MANIKIHDLAPAGLQLFSDTETYLTELATDEMALQKVHGGSTPCCIATGIYLVAAVGGALIGNDIGNALR